MLITVSCGFAVSLFLAPALSFQYTFWKMDRILDAVSEEELIGRTKDLPEVKAHLTKYDNSTGISTLAWIISSLNVILRTRIAAVPSHT